ncbi:MAG TPA: YfhO family protein [Cytophagaceae bacterium]|nr:YfhO family protein [Cytophagaceae bacterium]
MDQFFPWRYLISEHFNAGQLPLWNPYQNLGYPIHGDPQSGTWYPIVWLLTFFFGSYKLYVLHLEFVLTLYIASIGFYKFSRYFNYSVFTSLLLAYTYSCCGFFIGNAQHLTWIISGAFIPFILLYYLRTLDNGKISDALKTSFFMFMLLSGGYPAFLFTVSYMLVALFLVNFISTFKIRSRSEIWRAILLQGLIAVIFLLISSIVLYSIFYYRPYITRGEQLPLAKVLEGAFTIPSLLSFIFPFATCKHGDIMVTDISMANAYFGIIGLLFFISFLIRKNKSILEKTFLGIGIIMLLISLGNATPLRTFLHHYFPLMNLFRFPSLFRIFFIISFLVLAGSELERLIKDRTSINKIRLILSALMILIISIVSISYFKNYSGTNIFAFFLNQTFFKEHSTIYDHIIVQGFSQIAVLIFLFIALNFRDKNYFKYIVGLLLLLDLFGATQLNLPYTAADCTTDPKEVARMLEKEPSGFPIPGGLVINNNDSIHALEPFWRNLNIFRKNIAYDGYNPFCLKNYEKLETSSVYRNAMSNASVFLATNAMEIRSSEVPAIRDNQTVLMDSSDLQKYQDFFSSSSQKDTVLITQFKGNSFTLQSNTAQKRMVILCQNYLPAWHAMMDGKTAEIVVANYSLIAIPVEAGKHSILLYYQPEFLYFFLYLSVVSLTLLMFYFVYDTIKEQVKSSDGSTIIMEE